MNTNKPFVVVSDFHSTKEAMNKVYEYLLKGYKVIILGDAIDRGPYGDGADGIDMLLEIMNLTKYDDVIYIPGNHDELLYGYVVSDDEVVTDYYAGNIRHNGGDQTIDDINNLKKNSPNLFKKLINWLGNLPLQMVYEVDGQKYCFAHALFNQKVYDTNPNFSLSDFAQLEDLHYRSKYAKIFWFRKYKDSYNNNELPSKDSIMIIGHTPQEEGEYIDFNLVDNNGNTIEVINVDGGLAMGHDYMLAYDSINGRVVSVPLVNDKDNKETNTDKYRKVNRQKSSKISYGAIYDKFKKLENNVLNLIDNRGYATDLSIDKVNSLRDRISDKTSDVKHLERRIVEKISNPSKKMIASALLATSIVAAGGITFSNIKNIGNDTVAITDVDDKNYITYIVESGDTLSYIAYLYGISVKELASYNNISMSDYDNIKAGMVLKIPNIDDVKFVEYTVEDGDTLSYIALYFDVDIDTIMRDNNIDNADDITVGSVLKIRVSNKLESSNHKTLIKKI